MNNIEYNYCVTCCQKPSKSSHWCAKHKNGPTSFCSYCGAHLNSLLDHPQKNARQLCTGCTIAFAAKPVTVNSFAKQYMEQAIAKGSLPVHLVQSYQRHLTK